MSFCHNHIMAIQIYPIQIYPNLIVKVAFKFHIIYMPFHLCFFRWRSGVFKQINFNHGSYMHLFGHIAIAWKSFRTDS